MTRMSILSITVGVVWALVLNDASLSPALAAEPNENGVATKYDNLIKASELIGIDVAGASDSLGSIADLVLDLETSHAALALLAHQTKSGADVVVTLPVTAIARNKAAAALRPWVTDAMIQQSNASAPPVNAYTRRNVGERFSAFGQDPYWMSLQRPSVASSAVDESDHILVLFSDLQAMSVVSSDDKAVGKIVDLAIEPESSKIVYTILQSTDDSPKLYAIPLGAFVHKTKQTLQIEMQRDLILKRPSMNTAPLPKSIDRGWLEYVSVRYGREGVQDKPAAQRQSKTQ